MIRRLREENDAWRARRQPQSAPDPQLGSSGSSYPTLDQLTARVLTGGWPNLHDPYQTQSGYPTAAQRGGFGTYQPGPNIGMLPPIPFVPSAPSLISTGVISSVLPFSSVPTYSRPPPPVPQSVVSRSVPSATVASQPVRTPTQTAGPTPSGPMRTGPTPPGLSQAGPVQTQLSTAADQRRDDPNGAGRDRHNRHRSNRNTNRNQNDGLSGFQRLYPPHLVRTSSGPTQQTNVSIRPLPQPVATAVTTVAGMPVARTEGANEVIDALRRQNEEMRQTMQQFVHQVQDVRDQIAGAMERNEGDDEQSSESEDEEPYENASHSQHQQNQLAPPANLPVSQSIPTVPSQNLSVHQQNPPTSQTSTSVSQVNQPAPQQNRAPSQQNQNASQVPTTPGPTSSKSQNTSRIQ